jgi:DNA-damage-inducible protein J
MVATQTQKIRTSVYLDKQLKEDAKELFKKFHMTLNEAFNMFLAQSVIEQAIPFQSKIPNEETRKAMQEVLNGETEPVTFEQHMEEMKQCIKN